MPEDDLESALAADLDGSFERLVLAFQDRLYGFVLRYTGSPEDAEEVVQDALIRAYRALSTYEPERVRGLALRAWLYRIALNTARNRARGRRPATAPLQTPGDDRGVTEPAAADRERPDAVVEAAERTDHLRHLLAALPAQYRAAVVLRHLDGMGYDEVAEILGRPVGTVKSDVHRGMRLLRDAQAPQRRNGVA